MELTQNTLDNIILTATSLSFVCPICHRYVTPRMWIEDDEVKVERQAALTTEGAPIIICLTCKARIDKEKANE